jgi:tRNA(Ile)-lysidine synthase TilS/MesJ
MLPADGAVAIGVSGGLDSTVLVLLLTAMSRSLPRPLELVGLHVRIEVLGLGEPLTPAYHRWCAELGLEVEELEPRIEPADSLPGSACAVCAKVRRRALLEAAASRGCPTLALGHHADDVVDTWLMSLMYTGTASAMAAKRSYFDGAVTVIRPLHELRRGEIERMARLADAPPPIAACPAEPDNKRARVQAALRSLGKDQTLVRRQLYWAAVRELEAEPESRQGVVDPREDSGAVAGD